VYEEIGPILKLARAAVDSDNPECILCGHPGKALMYRVKEA